MKFRTLMMTTLIAGGMTGAALLPASALTLGSDAGVSVGVGANIGSTGVSVGTKAGTSAGGSTSAEGGAAVVAEGEGTSPMGTAEGAGKLGIVVAATAAANGDADLNGDGGAQILTQSAFMGNSVITADGKTVGTIDKVWLDGSGKSHLQVKLNDSLDRDYSHFSVMMNGEANADGSVKLGWTEAELMSTLDAQVAAQGNG